jgi:dihydroneopterin aldolase
MAIRSKWTVLIQSLRIGIRVGARKQARSRQAVQVSLKVSGVADSHPLSVGHCMDYDPLVHWLTHDLPAMPHTELLETRVNDIAQFVFSTDKRILGVWVGLYKEAALPNLPLIGVEKEMTRRQFDELQRTLKLAVPLKESVARRARTASVR